MEEKPYWVGFNHVKGIGAVRFKNILDYFGKLEIAWQAPTDAYLSLGLPGKILDNFVQIRQSIDLERIMDRLNQQGIQVITWEDDEYPRRLREINQPPPVLYVKGAILLQDDLAVGIVGTRRVTGYGRQVTEEFASRLAIEQVTVISGMARGVDSIAHDAAIKAGGRTIAVLGNGVDLIYPPENRMLAENIVKNGAVISDYPPGTAPDGANFPARNRIISGLARAVVVVEAGDKSGALITAGFAADQGRDVFAVPGGIYAPQSKGTNGLIQRGAIPLLRIDDLLESLDIIQAQKHQYAQLSLPADGMENILYQLLRNEALHIDDITSRSGLPIEQVSATLTMMELKGLVRLSGAMQYQSVQEEHGVYRIDEAN
jgi:DNA processing protein